MRSFGSDNHSGVHPELMKAILEANIDHEPSYGTDTFSERALEKIKEHFGATAQAFFCFNGTAANVLSLKATNQSYHSVLCSDVSHIYNDECGAPEYLAGCKLTPLPSTNGKISLAILQEAIVRGGDQHYSQPHTISLTQPTELGTCYTLSEIREITEFAHKNNLFVHMDGARLANAVVSLKTSFKEMVTESGIDVVSMGGTKNGFLFGEAVIFLKPSLAQDFKYIRKQLAQLPSKTRFIACQFERYLTNDLWKQIAEHSNRMARTLHESLAPYKKVHVEYPVQSNAVFAEIPQPWVKQIRKNYFFYVWDETTFVCRLMTSWDTSTQDIEGFINEISTCSVP